MEQGWEEESRYCRDQVDDRGRRVEPGHEDEQCDRRDHGDNELGKVLAEVALQLVDTLDQRYQEVAGALLVQSAGPQLDRLTVDLAPHPHLYRQGCAVARGLFQVLEERAKEDGRHDR